MSDTAAEMIWSLSFCAPCAAMLGIYRKRGSFAGILHALVQINGCPKCGPQLRDANPVYSAEEFTAHVVAAQARRER